jgi:hypothetical protein
MGGQMGDVFAEKPDATAGGRKVTGDGVEQGGLPGSIGPQNGTPLPCSDPHGHIHDCFQGTEGSPNAHQFQGEGSSNGV